MPFFKTSDTDIPVSRRSSCRIASVSSSILTVRVAMVGIASVLRDGSGVKIAVRLLDICRFAASKEDQDFHRFSTQLFSETIRPDPASNPL
jgi:hypothetical protein